VVSDLPDRDFHIKPEEINYDIYVNKFLHLTSDPDTSRQNMSVLSYDSKSRADDLFWAAAVRLYEDKVKFLPKKEADLYITLCQSVHIWRGHGHANGKISNNRIHKALLARTETPSFVHAPVLCFLFSWRVTKMRKWFPEWEEKFVPFPYMPRLVEGITDPRNQPDALAGQRHGLKIAQATRRENIRAKANRNAIRLIGPILQNRSQASARHQPQGVPNQDHDQDYMDWNPSPRTATKRARVEGFFDERDPPVESDALATADTYELNCEHQAEVQDSFTSADQTADTIVMEEDTVTVIPRKDFFASHNSAASNTSRQTDGQVTPAEAKLLHQMASKNLVEIDQKLTRVTKEIAQYENHLVQLRQEQDSLSDAYGKAKTRAVYWEVAEMGSV
jgi:hypothetical protein